MVTTDPSAGGPSPGGGVSGEFGPDSAQCAVAAGEEAPPEPPCSPDASSGRLGQAPAWTHTTSGRLHTPPPPGRLGRLASEKCVRGHFRARSCAGPPAKASTHPSLSPKWGPRQPRWRQLSSCRSHNPA